MYVIRKNDTRYTESTYISCAYLSRSHHVVVVAFSEHLRHLHYLYYYYHLKINDNLL